MLQCRQSWVNNKTVTATIAMIEVCTAFKAQTATISVAYIIQRLGCQHVIPDKVQNIHCIAVEIIHIFALLARWLRLSSLLEVFAEIKFLLLNRMLKASITVK